MRFSLLSLVVGCSLLIGSVQAEVPEDNKARAIYYRMIIVSP